MTLDLQRFQVPFWLIWSAGVALVTAIFVYWYWRIDAGDVKLLGFVGGVATGLSVYLLTYLTVLPPIMQLDRFRRMGIKGLLANRHDQAYYRNFVARSRIRVDVMGASCSRFVRDFLDVESDDKVLVDALSKHRNLKVRMLIPDDAHMGQEAQSCVTTTIGQVALVQERFPRRVELRRFKDEVRHSFVLTDSDLIAGPVFDDNLSRHAPAVHVNADTLFGQKYSAYFDAEWDRANGA